MSSNKTIPEAPESNAGDDFHNYELSKSPLIFLILKIMV